jgi:hypothetical protein
MRDVSSSSIGFILIDAVLDIRAVLTGQEAAGSARR